jgi:hypothetical protein
LNELGRAMEEVRRRRGLSKEGLARVLGLSRSSFWRLTSREPSPRDIEEALRERLRELNFDLVPEQSAERTYADRQADVVAHVPGGLLIIEARPQPDPRAVAERPDERISWSARARAAVKRFEAEAIEEGANDYDLAFIRKTLQSPEAYVVYNGGRPRQMTDEEMLIEMQGLAEGLRVWLRERIKRRGHASP